MQARQPRKRHTSCELVAHLIQVHGLGVNSPEDKEGLLPHCLCAVVVLLRHCREVADPGSVVLLLLPLQLPQVWTALC